MTSEYDGRIESAHTGYSGMPKENYGVRDGCLSLPGEDTSSVRAFGCDYFHWIASEFHNYMKRNEFK